MIPLGLQPCRRRDENQRGTDSSETDWRGLETKSAFRLCNHSKPQLISRPRRRRYSFGFTNSTVSAFASKAAAASQDAEPKPGSFEGAPLESREIYKRVATDPLMARPAGH